LTFAASSEPDRNVEIFQFSILSYGSRIASLARKVGPGYISAKGVIFLRPCKLKAVINHGVAGQSFIREPFELSGLSWIIKTTMERCGTDEITIKHYALR